MNRINPIKLFKNWLFERSEKKSVIIEVLVTDETVKTIQVIYKNQTVWLQKSLLKLNQYQEDRVNITIPLWLYVRKFPKLTYKSIKVKDSK